MSEYKTEQEKFWAGKFGDEYCDRNLGANLLASNVALFSKMLSHTVGIRSVIEFGANLGMNLKAIKALIPEVELSAIEINQKAVELLKQDPEIKQVYAESIFDHEPDGLQDLALIKTVLIHINPEKLQKVYELLYKSSRRYICIAEYYSPVPVTVTYRGNTDKLFKRDFAGEILEKYKDLKLIDYGFAYRRDPYYGAEYDDINWFLLEKRNV
jgi:spore coat polysaccharide biosynthesis protein SpsF